MAGQFSLDVSAFVKKAKGNGRAVARKIVLDVGTAIVMRTPVGDPTTWKRGAPPGYVGGRARGSWQYGNGVPLAQDPGTVDGSGQASVQRLQAGVAGHDGATLHYYTSTVPYMRRLEYEAWSKQAPSGMVRITIVEFQEFAAKAAAELNK